MCEIFQVNLGLENFIKCLFKIQELHGLKNLNNGVCLLEKVSAADSPMPLNKVFS